MSGLWDQDLSSQAFSALVGKEIQVHALEDGYERTTDRPIKNRPEVVSATLVLDRRLIPVREIMYVRSGHEVHQLRFVQTDYERKPSSSVPDAIFDPEYGPQSRPDHHSSSPQKDGRPDVIGTDVQLAQLQIAVLYQLNNLGADTGEPIEVIRTQDGRVRVSGAVTEGLLKQNIIAHLDALDDHHLLELSLISSRDVQIQVTGITRSTLENTSVYEVSEAKPVVDKTVRRYLQAKGLSGEQLNSAAEQYSTDALQHA
jgi:hypothetical protein